MTFLLDVYVPIGLIDPGHGQVTDSCFLGPAVAHGGMLATLDRRPVTDAVRRGRDSLRVI